MSEPIADQINPQSWSFKSVEKGPESLQLQIWGGKLSLCIFSNKQVIYKQNLAQDAFILFKKAMQAIQTAQPGTRRNTVFSTWDDEQKKAFPSSTLVIGKDERMVNFFEIQFKDRGNAKSVRFDMLSSMMVSTGSEPMSAADRSTLRVESVIDYLNYMYPVASVITSRKFKRQGGGGGGGNNGGGGGGNFGGGSPQF